MIPDKLHRLTRILRVEPFKITILWEKTEARTIDFAPLFEEWKQGNDTRLFPLFDYNFFKKVRIPDYNALQWPSGKSAEPLDLDAQVLYQRSTPAQDVTFFQVGETLRQAREKAGLSQSDLAKRCGASRQHISRIENGKSGIDLDTLQKIVSLGLGGKLEVSVQV